MIRRIIQKPLSYSGVWFRASRPFSLTAALIPVFLGNVIAAEQFELDWVLFACSVVGSMAIQIGTNLTDELTDHLKSGADSKHASIHKVLQLGLISEKEMFLGCILVFGIGVGMGIYIVTQVGWPILLVGATSIFVAVFYSSGPRPLGDIGLGELMVFIFMGPVIVMSSYYVQVQSVSWPAFWVSIPIAFLVTAILHCNNLRDLNEDLKTGKCTLVTMFGLEVGKLVFASMIFATYVTLVVIVSLQLIPVFGLLGLTSFPLALRILVRIFGAVGSDDMDRILVQTAKLHAFSGTLIIVGLLFNTFLH